MGALIFDPDRPCKDLSDMTEEEKQKLTEDLCKLVEDWFARNRVPRIPRLPNER